MKPVRTLLLVLLAIASLTSAGVAPSEAASSPAGGHVDQPLQQLARQQPTANVRVLVQGGRAADVSAAVQRTGGQVRKQLPHVASVAADLRADQAAALSAQPGVTRVMLDAPMNAVFGGFDPTQWPASAFSQTVGAPPLWSSGQTGRGVAIAVLDSGIQTHPDFGTRVIANVRFNNGASSSSDQYGHGTWVAGIAAGSGAASNGRYTGIAPGASLVNLKVSDDTGLAYTSDVVDALGWVVAHHWALNIRVVNMSFVSSLPESYSTNVLDAAIEMVWHSGVVVVASAGNQGPNTVRGAPANDPYVITVGASDDDATTSTWDDTLAWFSSYGITQDGVSKPDLVAPGRHIIGALASPGRGLAKQFPTKIIGDSYIQLSGTSASAPVVSGAIAILLQAYPHLSPDRVKWLLAHSARDVRGPAAALGGGELDLGNAMHNAGGWVGQANRGLTPNQLVALAYVASIGQPNLSWDSVSWDSVSWDSVSWDSVSWDSVSWDTSGWDAVGFDSILGD